MPTIKLTQTAIDKLPFPKSGQVLYRHSEKPGLAVRVTPTKKVFCVDKWSATQGRPLRVTLGNVENLTVTQAEREADKIIGKIASGGDPIKERRKKQAKAITLEKVFAEYLKRSSNLAPRTLRDYQYLMFGPVDPATGERTRNGLLSSLLAKTITSIDRATVERLHATLGERSQAQANYALRLLRAVLSFGSERFGSEGEPLILHNPVKSLKKSWFRVDRRQTYVKPGQLPSWFSAVLKLEEGTAKDFLQLLLLTGLRRGEAARMEWAHVDLTHKTLTIPDPKNHQAHTLPLSDYVLALLARRKESVPGRFVFPGSGKSGHYEDPKKAVARVAEASSVPFTCHDLRRTFITVAEGLDISAYAVKRLANHKTRNDITSGYIMADTERLRAPMQHITDYILRAAGLKGSADVLELPDQREGARA